MICIEMICNSENPECTERHRELNLIVPIDMITSEWIFIIAARSGLFD